MIENLEGRDISKHVYYSSCYYHYIKAQQGEHSAMVYLASIQVLCGMILILNGIYRLRSLHSPLVTAFEFIY